jgi:hypothetical protein
MNWDLHISLPGPNSKQAAAREISFYAAPLAYAYIRLISCSDIVRCRYVVKLKRCFSQQLHGLSVAGAAGLFQILKSLFQANIEARGQAGRCSSYGRNLLRYKFHYKYPTSKKDGMEHAFVNRLYDK